MTGYYPSHVYFWEMEYGIVVDNNCFLLSLTYLPLGIESFVIASKFRCAVVYISRRFKSSTP